MNSQPDSDDLAASEIPTSPAVEPTLEPPHPGRPRLVPATRRPMPEVPGYQILSELGRGGMGVVYKARHLHLNRVVALKMILSGAHAGPNDFARFKSESEAVAGLNHPNIVQIFEVGDHAGLPYFTLEFCPGGSLANECAGGPMPPRRAAEVVERVARAVAYAHARGIVHRDLKPDNVLIDENGEPKVTDFGLAKNVHLDGGITGTGAVLGTPQFMAPEQAGGTGNRVGPAADIWALGVVLYRMLAGVLPFAGDTALDTIHMALEQEPAAPRTVHSAVPRDMEVITLKCLSKDPARRYASAETLADDLRRWLDGKPITARPVGRTERAAKWVKRNKVVTASILTVSFALIAATVISTRYAISEAAQRRLAVQRYDEKELALRAEERQRSLAQRDRDAKQKALEAEAAQRRIAERENLLARSVKGFLLYDLLRLTDVNEQANRKADGQAGELRVAHDVTMRELLDRAAGELTEDKIEQKFPGEPLVQAEVLRLVGDTYLGVGRYDDAAALLERAESLYAGHPGDGGTDILFCRASLANAYRAAGRLDDAIPVFERTLRQCEAELGDDHPLTLVSRDNLATAFQADGRPDDAIPLLKRALEQAETELGEDHPQILASSNNLANVYREAGRSGEAIPLFEKALKRSEDRLGDDHPSTLTLRNNLALAYQNAGRLKDAIPLLELMLKQSEATLGEDHPNTLASRSNLADVYRATGRLNDAIPLFERTLKRLEATLGDDHSTVLHSRNNLALAYKDAGRLGEAIPLFERTLEQREAAQADDHPDTLISRYNLALAYKGAGRLGEAIPLFERTLKQSESRLGDDHPHTLVFLNGLAGAYRSAGRLEEAIPLLERAYAGVKKLLFLHPHALDIQDSLIVAYEKIGEFEKRESVLQDRLQLLRARTPNGDPVIAPTLAQLGECRLQLNKYAEAESACRECLQLREAAMPSSWLTANAESMLGEALLGQGRASEAEGMLLAGRSGMKAAFEAGKPADLPPPALRTRRLLEATARLVRLYESTGDSQRAAEWEAEWATLLMSRRSILFR